MLDAIKQTCQDYYDDLPPEALRKIAKSALYTFTASLWFARGKDLYVNVPRDPYNIARPLFNAGTVALASLIYTLTTPMFNKIFGDKDILLPREIMKHIVNLTLTAVVISYLTTPKVNMAALTILGMFSSNLLASYIDISIRFCDWLDPRGGAGVRRMVQWVGLQTQPGSASIYLNLFWG